MPTNNNKEELSSSELYHLIDRFFLKSSLLICSIVSHKPQDTPIFDDLWFNSHSDKTYNLPDIINQWIDFDGVKTLPPLVIDVFLDLRDITKNNLVRLEDDDGNLWNVCKGTKKTEIMLERWLIELDSDSTAFKTYDSSRESQTNLSDQITLLLRYLYTLIKLLPVYELSKQYERQDDNDDPTRAYSSKLTPIIGARIVDGSKPILSKGRIGLSKPILGLYANVINDTNIPPHLEQKKITPVWTKFGLLRVSVSYRRDCKFVIEDTSVQNTNISQPVVHDTLSVVTRKEKVTPDIHLRTGSLSPRSKEGTSYMPYDKNNKSISNQSSFNQRKSISISRQVQPFKVGSVNSVVMNNQNMSQNSSRNPSNSSFINNIQARRTSNGSTAGFIGHLNTPSNNALNVDSTSIDSGSKYMSSFGNLRRHSSINKNQEAIAHERKLLNINKQHSIPNTTTGTSIGVYPSGSVQSSVSPEATEDILKFVKILDEKPDIKGKHPSHSNNSVNVISSSLLKFKNLKPSNDLLSEDLSMSVSLNQPHGEQGVNPPTHIDPFIASYPSHLQTVPSTDSNTVGRRRRSSSISNSHSPLPSMFTPPVHYPSIPSKLVDGQNESEGSRIHPAGSGNTEERNTVVTKTTRYTNTDMGEHITTHTIPHVMSSNFNLSSRKNSIDEEDEDQDEELLVNPQQIPYDEISKKIRVSSSPRSIDSIASSFSRNRIAYKQPYQQFSQPVIAQTSAQAKLHKPGIHSTDILEDQDRLIRRRDSEEGNARRNMVQTDKDRHGSNNSTTHNNQNEEDDDMVFFMSDMNLSHE